MHWLPLLPFAFFFVWLLSTSARHRRHCPVCSHPFPRIPSPFKKTKRQWIEGGRTCGHCGCETDDSGAAIAGGTAFDSRALVIKVGWIAIAALPAVAMMRLLISG